LKTPANITLFSGIKQATPGLAKDIVFREKTTGNAFFLSNIAKSATLSFVENTSKDFSGGKPGCGVYSISGDLLLYQNSADAIRAIRKHRGFRYDVFVLFFDGSCTASCLVEGITANSKGNPKEENILFPNASKFRAHTGVVLQITDDAVSARNLHILVTGSTFDKTEWRVTKDSDFYKLFPSKDKANTNKEQ
jgi:hypothetical protein